MAQVEYYFSTTELAKNVFLRKYMDGCGYVPFAIVYNFPSILSFHIPYSELLDGVNVLSKKLDVDLVNECVRIKYKSDSTEQGEDPHKKWLFPNPDGSLGCPRWIKEPTPEVTPSEEVAEEESPFPKDRDNAELSGSPDTEKEGSEDAEETCSDTTSTSSNSESSSTEKEETAIFP